MCYNNIRLLNCRKGVIFLLKKCLLITMLFLLLAGPACLASPADDNAMFAVALYIDTSGHYVPGIDILNKALNEIIRFKFNALFLGSEVHSGNEVLRDLNRVGINNTASATPSSLTAYAEATHVNYVILFTIRPADVSMDLKAFSKATGSFIADKTVARPDGSDTLSTLDTFSAMISDEISQLFQLIHS